MPVQTSYPGVYVQEVPSGVRTIVGVTTSVTAFVGVARQGPVDQPVRVRSMAEYVRSFGPPLEETRPMGHAVGQFFVNGGSEAVVVRVVGAGAARAEVTLRTVGSSPIDLFRLQAKGAGAWANKVGGAGMEASVDYASTSNPADLFSLVIRLLGPDPRSGESVVLAEEVFQDLSAAPAHPRFAPTVLLGSALVDVVVPDPPPTSAAQASSTGIQLAEGNLELGAANGVLRLAVNHAPPMDLVIAAASTPTSVPKPGIVRAINEAAAAAGLPVAAGGAANRFVLTTNTPGGGADTSVVVGVAPANDASQVLGLGRAWGGEEKSGAAALRPAQTPGNPLRFTGGADAAVTPEDIVPASGRGGIYALGVLDFPRFNLLCLPDLPASDPTAPATAENSTKLSAALAFCKAERAFLIVDTPKDWPITPTPNVGGLAALGEHGALYYPRVTVAEQGPGGLPRLVDLPASGAIAGVMARTDAARGIWKAPAGLEAGLAGISGLSAHTDDGVSGALNPLGINVLRTFPGAGTVVWGARTLKGADSQASEFKYIPVRRLTDFIASSLQRGTQFAVFEPNDPDLWAQLRLAVGAFMRGLFTAGAFQQSAQRSEADSYFVVCDETVNPQSEIDLGRVNVVVGFAPVKPAEYVIVTITQLSQLEA